MNKTLIVITTILPPGVCGVGDYSRLLMAAWPDPPPHAVYLVREGMEESRAMLPDVEIEVLGAGASGLSAMLKRHPGADILLHYTSRAYQRHGVPLGLWRVLRRWRQAQPQAKLTVIFHELWLDLPWWNRHYSLQRMARRVILGIAGLATRVFTHTEHHARQLLDNGVIVPVSWHPVGSNIDPASGKTAVFRKPGHFLLLGLPFTRRLAIEAGSAWWGPLHAAGVLKCLHLVGPEDPRHTVAEEQVLNPAMPPECVLRHGSLPAEEVSVLLREAACCWVGLAPENLTKSGTFMAAASHECPVVSPHARAGVTTPLAWCLAPEELLRTGAEEMTVISREKAAQLRQWYEREAGWAMSAARVAEAFS